MHQISVIYVLVCNYCSNDATCVVYHSVYNVHEISVIYILVCNYFPCLSSKIKQDDNCVM